MNEQRPDFELLRQFVHRKDQAAFAVVVRRHLDLVYGTALRKVTDQGAAEELVQDVFAALARNAWRFGVADSVPAWLHRTTLNQASGWWRGEYRRRRREQTAAELGTTMKTPDEQPALRALVPMLDEALLSLREKDRAALLLRFHENRSFREVGVSMGVSEDAAQKRVSTAVDKIAHFFQRRGFKTASVAATTAALQRTAVPAPATFAISITQLAMQITPPAFVGVGVITRMAALTTMQKVVVAIALLAIPVAWHWKQNGHAVERPVPLIAEPQTLPQPNAVMATVQAPSPQPLPEPEPAVVAPAAKIEKPYTTRLTALIDLPGFKAAFLEVSYPMTNQLRTREGLRTNVVSQTNYYALKESQSAAESIPWLPGGVRIEILQVDAETGSVKATEAGEGIVYTFESSENPGTRRPNVRFQSAAFLPTAKIFGELANRTALLHPLCSQKPVSLAASAHSLTEAADALKAALKANHLAISSDGEKFEWIVPEQLLHSLSNPSAPTASSTVTNAEAQLVPAGMIVFRNLPLPQALEIYGSFTGRKLVESQNVGWGSINLVTQTALTKDEVRYAFETLFTWHGLEIVPVDEKSFKVVRRSGGR